jgi:hypothetical protein
MFEPSGSGLISRNASTQAVKEPVRRRAVHARAGAFKRSRRRSWFVILVIGLIAPVLAYADQAACEKARNAASTAIEGRHIDAFNRLAPALDACEAEVRKKMLSDMAMAIVEEAERRMREMNATLAQQRPLIDQALRLGSPWPAFGLECELRHEQRQYLKAQISCERALVEIEQTDLPTDPKATARIFKLAEESRLLAGQY